jgi:hypothetical protein
VSAPGERPLAACLDDFWESPPAPAPAAPDAGAGADPAPRRLAPPRLALHGRDLTDLLGPAYEAFAAW